MLIRGRYPDPAASGNEQVLTPVGAGAERKEGRGEEEGIDGVTGRQVGGLGSALAAVLGVGGAPHWAPGLGSRLKFSLSEAGVPGTL